MKHRVNRGGLFMLAGALLAEPAGAQVNLQDEMLREFVGRALAPSPLTPRELKQREREEKRLIERREKLIAGTAPFRIISEDPDILLVRETAGGPIVKVDLAQQRRERIVKERAATREKMISSGNPFFSSSDGAGLVEFRETAGGPIQSMTPGEYETWTAKRYSDQTTISGDNGHGWQAEYTSAGGQAFLWYPGNDRIVEGRWRTRLEKGSVSICFTYSAGYNPVTDTAAGNEECQFASPIDLFATVERRTGDVFKLANGSVPYKRAKTEKPAWPSE